MAFFNKFKGVVSNLNIGTINHMKRSYRNHKSNLKISINDIENNRQSPNSCRSRPRLHHQDKAYETNKAKRNLKSCKSMRSIEPGSHSSRNRKEELR